MNCHTTTGAADPLLPKAPDQRFTPVHPLDVECLYDDNNKTLMSKGHQDPAEFMKACEEWYGGPLQGWGKVRHGWGRTVPDSTGEYKFLMLPAKPHARGAYPTTTVIDDPAYDHDDA